MSNKTSKVYGEDFKKAIVGARTHFFVRTCDEEDEPVDVGIVQSYY